jgi:predicted unusual protein kinase regulating ubiquinone biosynthesis (AarF/ABC1/UbiB family)
MASVVGRWDLSGPGPEVKLGQILSCREDLVPKEYINELPLSQDMGVS